MLATVIVVVWTHNLALGVLVGVLLSGIFFTGKVRSMFGVVRTRDADTATYVVTGQIFFASVDRFSAALRPRKRPTRPGRPCHHRRHPRAFLGHFRRRMCSTRWSNGCAATAAACRCVGLNEASADLVDRFALTDKTGVEIGLAPHP